MKQMNSNAQGANTGNVQNTRGVSKLTPHTIIMSVSILRLKLYSRLPFLEEGLVVQLLIYVLGSAEIFPSFFI